MWYNTLNPIIQMPPPAHQSRPGYASLLSGPAAVPAPGLYSLIRPKQDLSPLRERGSHRTSSPPSVIISEDQWFPQRLRIPNRIMKANHSSALMVTYREARKPVRNREVSTSFCQKQPLGVPGKVVMSFSSWALRWVERRGLAMPRLHELKLMTTLLRPVPSIQGERSACLSTSFRPNAMSGTRERHLPSAVSASSGTLRGNSSRRRSLRVAMERARHLASATLWKGSPGCNFHNSAQFPNYSASPQPWFQRQGAALAKCRQRLIWHTARQQFEKTELTGGHGACPALGKCRSLEELAQTAISTNHRNFPITLLRLNRVFRGRTPAGETPALPGKKRHGDHNFYTWRRQPPALGNEFAC